MNLTPSQKRSLHLKAAMALQKRRMGFSRFAEALAHHWEVSLQQSEALSAWLEAGRYERSQFNRNEVLPCLWKWVGPDHESPNPFSGKGCL